MEIFVSELPKCCEQCKINCLKKQNNVSCFIADCDGCIGGRPKGCPLKLLSTRLAEERKKVVQMIKAEFEPSPDSTVITGTPTPEAELINRGFGACKRRFYEILDKVERGEL